MLVLVLMLMVMVMVVVLVFVVVMVTVAFLAVAIIIVMVVVAAAGTMLAVMVMFLLKFFKGGGKRVYVFNCLAKLLAGELIPGGGNDGRAFVVLSYKLNTAVELALVKSVGAA